MPLQTVEEDFMAGLFADLDASAFPSDPPSSQTTATARPATRPAKCSQSISRLLSTPQKRACSLVASPCSSSRPSKSTPSHSAATPKPFWNDPYAHPTLTPRSLADREQREREAGIIPSGPGGVKKRRPPQSATAAGILSPKPNRTLKRERDEGNKTPGKAVKHVAIEVEGKENEKQLRTGGGVKEPQSLPPSVPRAKGKREMAAEVWARPDEPEDEFGELAMEDVDWDKEMLGFEADSAAAAQPKPLPRNKQYTRSMVEEIVDLVGPSLRPQKILVVSGSTFEGLRQVVLCDDWIETPVECGDTINLIGSFDASISSAPSLTLNRSDGLLILHPDILVSSTKIADSTNCTRKAVLTELIRTVGGLSPALVYGNMLHSLMQSCLSGGKWDEEYRFAKIEEIIHETGGQLWTMEVSFEKARAELRERSKEYGAFAERFLGDKPKPDAILSDLRAADAARSRLALSSTLAIEEDIWSPRFGIKGKIDVSTSSTVVDSIGFTRKGTAPFEIKTGRTTAGMEHRAQTMLYTLLMSDRYDEEVDSGLLYYTQSNEVFRVQAARNEIRGLILARNRFATYLHRRMTLTPSGAPAASQVPPLSSQFTAGEEGAAADKAEEEDGSEEDDEDALWAAMGTPCTPPSSQAGDLALLPPPIDEERSCRKCFVRDACMVFRKTVEGDVEISTDEEDPLQVIYADQTGHLTYAHAEFFKHWEKLICYEEQELVRFKKEIWTMQAEEREKAGRCLANMVIGGVKAEDMHDSPQIHRFTYRLIPSARKVVDGVSSLADGSFSVNDAVVLSLEEPCVLAISRGFVLSLTSTEIVVGLDQSLTDFPQAKRCEPSSELVFRIDKDELAAGMGRIRDNLLQLFLAKGDEQRRRLIVDLEPPSFDSSLGSTTSKDRLIPSTLNEDQKGALEKVLSAQDYALILGMPGTGKTTTIAEVLKALAKAGKSVLLTSYTHSAVDNILLKVKDAGLSILRLGNRDKIMPALHPYTLTAEDYASSLADIDNKLMTPQIVATTCLGINEPIFTKRRFDVCIVDEASQVTLPTCLGPLRFADKFILVGDHNQLPPLVRNMSARKGGLDVSLFKRLSDAHPAAVVNLTHQYRMNEDIMLLSNTLVYDHQLQIGNEQVGQQRLVLPQPAQMETLEPWVKEVVDPSRTVLFVDTDALPARESKKGSLIENELEALLVKETISALQTCGVAESDVAVITPYRQQIKLLHRELVSFPGVEILTADRSQGRDKEVVLVSLVRSNMAGSVGDLLKDWRRLNVCLTRAKSKLVLFGSRSTLRHVPLLQQFLVLVEEKEWVYVINGALRAQLIPSMGVKVEVEEGEDVKPLRRGGGALALKKPMATDILNSL
ncbi:hypothetical protein JCM11641_007653 [Rhodosporidiobolus odoratus]